MVFPTFRFESEFGNKVFTTWATISSQSYFCWLHRASPSLAAKNIINLILVLTIWWCPCVESSLVLLEEGVCYDQCVLLAKLLAFALLLFEGHKQNLVCTRTQEKGAVTPQETDPDLLVSVQESPAEAWVSSGLLQGWGHWVQQCMHGTFWRGHHYFINFTVVWSQVKQQGGEHSPTHQQKIGLNIYWEWTSEQDPVPPHPSPPVSPIRKLP